MANNIFYKRNTVSQKVPAPSDLVPGELAVNVADGTVFMAVTKPATQDFLNQQPDYSRNFVTTYDPAKLFRTTTGDLFVFRRSVAYADTVPTILKFYSNGTQDKSFNPDVAAAYSAVAGAFAVPNTPRTFFAVQSTGKVVCFFSALPAADGGQQSVVFRLNADGTHDTEFAGRLFRGFVTGAIADNSNKIVVVGEELSYSGETAADAFRLNSSGTLDVVIAPVDVQLVAPLVLDNNGQVLCGSYGLPPPGYAVQAASFAGIARINADGTAVHTAFNPPIFVTWEPTAFAVQANGDIVVSGRDGFDPQTGNGNSLFRVTPACVRDSGFDLNVGDGLRFLSNTVQFGYANSLQLTAANKILIGGNFSAYNGIPTQNIVQLNNDGTIDPSFYVGSGFNRPVHDIVALDNDTFAVIGEFTTYNGQSCPNLVFLNTAGHIVSSPYDFWGFNGTVNTIAAQPASIADPAVTYPDDAISVLMGGSFSQYADFNCGPMLRLLRDGSVIDKSFVPQFFTEASDTATLEYFSNLSFSQPGVISVTKIVPEPGGKIFVELLFGGIIQTIVRLNADGTKDTTFAVDTTLTALVGEDTFFYRANVRIVHLQNDGRLIVKSAPAPGSAEVKLFRLNTDGSIDSTYADWQRDNALFLVAVTNYPGTDNLSVVFRETRTTGRYQLYKLDSAGTVVANTTAFFNNPVQQLVAYADGKILVFGASISGIAPTAAADFTAVQNVLRLNPDGTLDATFTHLTNAGAGIAGAGTIAVAGFIPLASTPVFEGTDPSYFDQAYRTLVFGHFESYAGVAAKNIVIINDDGSLYTPPSAVDTLGPLARLELPYVSNSDAGIKAVFGFQLNVFTRSLYALNQPASGPFFPFSDVDYFFYVGGSFAGQYSPQESVRARRLNCILETPGNSMPTPAAEPVMFGQLPIHSGLPANSRVVVTRDNKILISGPVGYNGNAARGLVRLNSDGSLDETFASALDFLPTTYGLYRGPVVVPQKDGQILAAGFTGSVRLNSDGTSDETFQLGAGITILAQQEDGKLLGTTAALTSDAYVFRFYLDGTPDNSFSAAGIWPGAWSRPHGLAIQPDGKILVWGESNERLIRINSDGSLDNSFTVADTPIALRTGVAVQADGKIVIVGRAIDENNPTADPRICRLNTDGTLDSSFVAGAGFDNSVVGVLLQPDGKILAYGRFSTYQNFSCAGIARINSTGSFDTTFNFDVDFAVSVSSAALQPSGHILITGLVSEYNEQLYSRILRLQPDGRPMATLNTDAVVMPIGNWEVVTDGFLAAATGKTYLMPRYAAISYTVTAQGYIFDPPVGQLGDVYFVWVAGGVWLYKVGTGDEEDEDAPGRLFARVFVSGYSVDGVTVVPHWETKILSPQLVSGTTTVVAVDGGRF